MSTLELKVYDILKLKLGETEAATVIEYFESKTKEVSDNKFIVHQTLQTKDMESLRNEIHNVFATKEDMANSKADIIKWMFIFWIGQVAVTFGLIMLYLKK